MHIQYCEELTLIAHGGRIERVHALWTSNESKPPNVLNEILEMFIYEMTIIEYILRNWGEIISSKIKIKSKQLK